MIHKNAEVDYFGRRVCSEVNRFIVLDDNDRVMKKLCCSGVEGEICNKSVWLTESNPAKAAEILIRYEEEQIAKLRFQINNHEDLITSLKEEIEAQ